MAFKWSSSNSDLSPATIEVAKTAETAMVKGEVLMVDRANNAVERGTSSMTTVTMFGVCMQTRTSTQETVEVVPFALGQIWEADTNADTHATNQTLERAALTDQLLLNNSASDVTGTTGCFVILKPIGAVGDRKVLVMPLGPAAISA